MPRSCLVLGCNYQSDKNVDVQLFCIPSIQNMDGVVDQGRMNRHAKWVAALCRSDLTEAKIKNGAVCSAHFITGAPIDDPCNPDYIPSQNMGYNRDIPCSSTGCQKYKTLGRQGIEQEEEISIEESYMPSSLSHTNKMDNQLEYYDKPDIINTIKLEEPISDVSLFMENSSGLSERTTIMKPREAQITQSCLDTSSVDTKMPASHNSHQMGQQEIGVHLTEVGLSGYLDDHNYSKPRICPDEEGTSIPSKITENSESEKAESKEQNIAKTMEKCRTSQKSFCSFCKIPVINFQKHIETNHSSEFEVQQILSKPKGSEERKKLLTLLINKGNYSQNQQNRLPPTRKAALKQFSICIPRLERRKKRPRNRESSTKSSRSNLLVKHQKLDSRLQGVFDSMSDDIISSVAKQDTLIASYAVTYHLNHQERDFVNTVSQKMRLLARLLIEMQMLNPRIINLFDALKPEHFKTIVQAVKYCAFNNANTLKNRRSLYTGSIRAALKQCCSIAIKEVQVNQDLYKNPDEVVANIRGIREIIHSQWNIGEDGAMKLKKSNNGDNRGDLEKSSEEQK